MTIKEPMLAQKIKSLKQLEGLKYPQLGSPKIDGIRAVHRNGELVSRKFKRIPNAHIRSLFEVPMLAHVDGELIAGPPTALNVYNVTQSAVSTHAGTPDVQFYLFDHFHPAARQLPFVDRLRSVEILVREAKGAGIPVRFVRHHILQSPADVLAFEERCLNYGYEGVMLRAPDGPYREGRCTVPEGYLFKMKRIDQIEAVIVGVRPKLHNANPAEVNELGRTKRSSHKANKVELDTLGGLDLILPNGVRFSAPMGKGWNDADKLRLWRMREQLLGQTVVVETMPYGVKDRPRQPKVKGFRDLEFDG